jgi:hypothetical protein
LRRLAGASAAGIPIANGMSDYFTMLNERDGGIGGQRLIVEECQTGYDTKKLRCYLNISSVFSAQSTALAWAMRYSVRIYISRNRAIAISQSSSTRPPPFA